LSDSSFIQQLDPRLAKPFLVGFSQAMDLVFLIGSAVMVIAFIVVWFLPHVELRSGSSYESRGRQDAADAETSDAKAADATTNDATADDAETIVKEGDALTSLSH
jgi:cytoskeletal protein RodZ